MRHLWPFSVHRVLYVAVHERTKLRSLLIRKRPGEDINGSECAGFCGDRKLGRIEVTPDLDSDERNEQSEDGPKHWQHSRRERLERPSPITHCEPNHEQIDAGSDKVCGRKDNHRHPRYRKIEEPVAHDPHPLLCRDPRPIDGTPAPIPPVGPIAWGKYNANATGACCPLWVISRPEMEDAGMSALPPERTCLASSSMSAKCQ